jgi:Holliday junction resolvasome RuvABC endonuclease subunit
MNQRLLSIDQGSIACAVAYFDVDETRPSSTDLFRPKGGLPWLERMQYIAAELLRSARTRGWNPDVVAIEDVVLGRNVTGVKVMSMTRGYLYRVVGDLFPRIRYIDINPSSTKAAARASMRRAAAKDDIRWAVLQMTGLEGLSEDECDAIAVGWAAFGKLRERSYLELANQQALSVATKSTRGGT